MAMTGLSATATRGRVSALPAADLAMLVRFALLRELHPEAAGPGLSHRAMSLAAVAYVACRRIDAVEWCWPLLRQLACDWIVLRRTS